MANIPIELNNKGAEDIKAYLLKFPGLVEQTIIYNLSYVGDECLKAARLSSSYTDQTGNLRSSIGFRLLKDGELIKESAFEVFKDGKEGSEKGIAKLETIIASFPKGIVLVFVAGMEYAGYVADTGRDVLDSAALLADKLVPEMLDKVKKQINEQ